MIAKTPLLATAGVSAALLIAFALSGAGCASRPPDELATAIATGERPVAMRGKGLFFDGKLSATVTISRGIGRGLPGGGSQKQAKQLNTDFMSVEDTQAYTMAKVQVGSPLPPVTLHLKIENLLNSTLLVEILDFNSDLGNFAARPAILALAPEQIAEPDPMISQLGVTSDDIPVVVTLRMNGVKETQTIMVRNIIEKAAVDEDQESVTSKRDEDMMSREQRSWTPVAGQNP